jgi:Leucine-rich repeat (LRR) protein
MLAPASAAENGPAKPIPAAKAQVAAAPGWLTEALGRVPAEARNSPAAIVQLYISRDARIAAEAWSEQDLALLARFPNLKDLTMNGPGFLPGALGGLKTLARLERLYLNVPLTDADLGQVAGLSGLRRLTLASAKNVTAEGMKQLADSKGLEELKVGFLGSDGGDAELLRPLAGMTSLKVLRFHVHLPTPARLAAVAELKGPAALDFTIGPPAKGLSFAEIYAPLRGMPNIRSLLLYLNGPDSDAALAVVGTFANLQQLDLQEAKLTDASLAHLAPLKNLRELNLARCGITDAGMANLKPLVGLQKLDLSGAIVTDACRTTLQGMVDLRELTIVNSGIGDAKGFGDATLEVIGGLPHLESLNISGNDITDAGLAHLVGLKNLRELYVGGCEKVTDQGLVSLGKITSLQVLSLNRTPVTEKGMPFLVGLRNLRELGLVNCAVNRQLALDYLRERKGLALKFTGQEWFSEFDTVTVGAAAKAQSSTSP